MPKTIFRKSFTQPPPIPEQGIAAAVALLRGGRLHRYDTGAGELSAAAQLEREFARWQGRDYCLACASGGYALHIGLRALGVKDGDAVLANAWTLAPVPGAIVAAGGAPVLVEIDARYHVDLSDLRAKAEASGARVLVLSLMRGHIPDMDALIAVCDELGLLVLEDCAHTMGASWDGKKSGNFGTLAAFSLQSYKHINCGEGGLLVGDDADAMARAVLLSGAYMLYERHGAAPQPRVFADLAPQCANLSGRMDNLRATLAIAQLPRLRENCRRWNALYNELHRAIRTIAGLSIPERDAREGFVGSSIQFTAAGMAVAAIPDFVAACSRRGVELKWFGAARPKGYTSRYDSWAYLRPQHLPRTLAVLEKTLDMRIPLTFDATDCGVIAQILREESVAFVGEHRRSGAKR